MSIATIDKIDYMVDTEVHYQAAQKNVQCYDVGEFCGLSAYRCSRIPVLFTRIESATMRDYYSEKLTDGYDFIWIGKRILGHTSGVVINNSFCVCDAATKYARLFSKTHAQSYTQSMSSSYLTSAIRGCGYLYGAIGYANRQVKDYRIYFKDVGIVTGGPIKSRLDAMLAAVAMARLPFQFEKHLREIVESLPVTISMMDEHTLTDKLLCMLGGNQRIGTYVTSVYTIKMVRLLKHIETLAKCKQYKQLALVNSYIDSQFCGSLRKQQKEETFNVISA